jgi:hypothetical protein
VSHKPTSYKPKPKEPLSLGKAYARVLRIKAQLLRTDLLVSKQVRQQIAQDLEALAVIAETTPGVFSKLSLKD